MTFEVHTKHLETLSIQNHELVAELDHYHHHDEKVRTTLADRRERVGDVANKHDEKMKLSITNMHQSLRSPTRKITGNN